MIAVLLEDIHSEAREPLYCIAGIARSKPGQIVVKALVSPHQPICHGCRILRA